MTEPAVVVTGASSGIGEAVARRLAARGFRVYGGYRDSTDAGRLRSVGVTPIRLDVTDPASVSAAADEVRAGLGSLRLAGLVNNAGIPGAGPVELTPVEVFREVMEVNLFGVVCATRAFLSMLREGRGRIVMMSSLSGLVAMPFLGPYAASKHALEALSDCLRRELLPEEIDLVVIEPGPIATPIWEHVEAIDTSDYEGTPYADPARRARAAALESGRRGLPPETVARAVERALTARRPKSRIVITDRPGRWKLRLIRCLPDRLADRLIASRG